MKDKTDSMNRDAIGPGSQFGYEKQPDSEIQSFRDRKNRQLKWANLEDNEALLRYENVLNADEDFEAGFLPRNNFEDRF